MKWKSTFIELVRSTFEERKKLDPNYSLRALAREIDLSPGGLSNLLNHRLLISPERASELMDKMQLPSRTKNYLLALMGRSGKAEFTQVDDEKFRPFTKWSYMAIPHFFGLENFEPTSENIAKRLNISKAEVETAIEHLIESNFLRKNEDGSITKEEIYFGVGDGPPREVIRAHHADGLDLAKRALSVVGHERRQFSTMTFTGDEAQLEEARAAVLEAHQRVSSIMEGAGKRNHVYRMTFALFPIDFEAKNETGAATT